MKRIQLIRDAVYLLWLSLMNPKEAETALGFVKHGYAKTAVPPFDEWVREVRRIGRMLLGSDKALDDWDEAEWKRSYNDGRTPAQAWKDFYDAA